MKLSVIFSTALFASGILAAPKGQNGIARRQAARNGTSIQRVDRPKSGNDSDTDYSTNWTGVFLQPLQPVKLSMQFLQVLLCPNHLSHLAMEAEPTQQLSGLESMEIPIRMPSGKPELMCKSLSSCLSEIRADSGQDRNKVKPQNDLLLRCMV